MKKINNLSKTVLVIAGSDPSGGAGIQADLKTLTSLGVYGMTAITALTEQNTNGVSDIFEIPLDFVVKQINCCLSDIHINAVKIGMLHSAELILAVYEALNNNNILSKKDINLAVIGLGYVGLPLVLEFSKKTQDDHQIPILLHKKERLLQAVARQVFLEPGIGRG